MKTLAIFAALLFVSLSAHAQAAKPCEELKSEIAKKMDDKGVKSYSLEIVTNDSTAEGKVVGTCEGGTKKIMYRRTSTPALQTPAPEATKP